MKLFVALMLLVGSLSARAGVLQSKEIVCSTNNTPTAYDISDAGSNMSFDAEQSVHARKLCCTNKTAVAASAYIDNGVATTPDLCREQERLLLRELWAMFHDPDEAKNIRSVAKRLRSCDRCGKADLRTS